MENPMSNQVLEVANAHSWEAGALATLMVAIVAFFAWVLKSVLADSRAREERMAKRLSDLEAEIRTELFSQLRQNAEVIQRSISCSDSMVKAAERMIATLDRFDFSLTSHQSFLKQMEDILEVRRTLDLEK
jgi:DNA anti-recombination protein RmuC